MIECYTWKDGRGIFETDTTHLRLLLNPPVTEMHVGLQKWAKFSVQVPPPKALWTDTWKPFRAAKINCFLWQLIYRIPATNVCRWPKLPRTHEDTHYKRFTNREAKEINHCFWECPKVHGIWRWVEFMLQQMTTHPQDRIWLTLGQTLVGVPMEDTVMVPEKWWVVLHAASIWYIWIARNVKTRQNK